MSRPSAGTALRRGALAVSAALALLVSGCAAKGEEPSAPASGPVPGSEWGTSAEALEALYKGTFTAPPASGPKAQAGKKVWIISCGQASTACATPVNAMEAAGEAIGWDVTVFDGERNPTRFGQGITQAIAAGADGILTQAIDCAGVVGPYTQAKAADIELVGLYAFDCDDPADKTGPGVFSTFVKYHGYETAGDAIRGWGAARAPWVIEKTGGKAKAITLWVPGFLMTELTDQGFAQALEAQCADCEILDHHEISLADLAANRAGAAFSTVLQRHPDANAIHAYADGVFQQFLNSSINSTGRQGIAAIGGECLPDNIEQIRSGGPQQACVVLNSEWAGWAAVDALNRQFAEPGSAPVDQGVGFQLVDKDHNLPASGPWVSPVDFASAYKKVWGVS
ncbi:substrate-binding domain-containing protein [Actinocorallia aurea]